MRKREHPQALRPYLQEIEAFARHNHFSVLHPILRCARVRSLHHGAEIKYLRLLALGLELPEDALVDHHKFEAAGESSGNSFAPLFLRALCLTICFEVRFMK